MSWLQIAGIISLIISVIAIFGAFLEDYKYDHSVHLGDFLLLTALCLVPGFNLLMIMAVFDIEPPQWWDKLMEVKIIDRSKHR